jgi:alkylhydroperoxidase family enzyme
MRIKGVDPEHPPASVADAFKKMAELTGRVVTPALVLAHRPEIFLATARLNRAVGASQVVDPRLKFMLSVRVAQMIGCPF